MESMGVHERVLQEYLSKNDQGVQYLNGSAVTVASPNKKD
jgi:hypothetical protein